jgi:hypothetical protein
MDLLDQREEAEDRYVATYRAMARKSGGNYVRAAGHGVLDVMTLGLWEVAGTPVEGAISNNRGYITANVIYVNKRKDKVVSVEIYDAHGALVPSDAA